MISTEQAAKAAKQILGFYPEIPASDPKGFAAGLVATLSIFPQAVIDRAVDPVHGLPSKVAYLNLAQMRKHLDGWLEEFWTEHDRQERAARKALPEPPRDPEAEARIAAGLKELAEQLKRGIGPSNV
jgi:hypothetical protein